MARIEAAPEVLEDFDRFFEHLARFEVRDAAGRLAEILQAVDVLGRVRSLAGQSRMANASS